MYLIYLSFIMTFFLIRKNWYFDCSCMRCSDPTELGTLVSGVVCDQCTDHCTLLPGLDNYSAPCGHSLPLEQVLELEARMEEEMQQCDGSVLEDLEHFLNKWRTRFNENHFLILLAKRKLLAALKINLAAEATDNREALSR